MLFSQLRNYEAQYELHKNSQKEEERKTAEKIKHYMEKGLLRNCHPQTFMKSILTQYDKFEKDKMTRESEFYKTSLEGVEGSSPEKSRAGLPKGGAMLKKLKAITGSIVKSKNDT